MSKVTLLDENQNIVANVVDLTFDEKSNAYLGQIEFLLPPEGLLRALHQLEDLVDNQVFSAVDQIQDDVDNFNLSASFEDRTVRKICDLYVNNEREVSFRVILN